MNLTLNKSSILKWIIFLLALSLFSCTTDYDAPVGEVGERSTSSLRVSSVGAVKSGSHQVRAGETLYAIAFHYSLDYSSLATANNISPPYLIFPGQVLTLNTNNRVASQSRPDNTTPAPTRKEPTAITNRTAPKVIPLSNSPQTKIEWAWPANGRIIAEFSDSQGENKGLDIAGKKGDSVFSAAAGEVVYAGNGLLRYGELLIIKHDAQHLSAYAHNDKLLVTDGDTVKKGERIATLGSTGIDREMLHFEIRVNGVPANPKRFLPSR